MKKITLIFLLFVTYFASAQEFSFGFRGGYNLAGIQGDNANSFQMRHGFHLGIAGEFGFTDTFSIQPEMLVFNEFAILDLKQGSYKMKRL